MEKTLGLHLINGLYKSKKYELQSQRNKFPLLFQSLILINVAGNIIAAIIISSWR